MFQGQLGTARTAGARNAFIVQHCRLRSMQETIQNPQSGESMNVNSGLCEFCFVHFSTVDRSNMLALKLHGSMHANLPWVTRGLIPMHVTVISPDFVAIVRTPNCVLVINWFNSSDVNGSFEGLVWSPSLPKPSKSGRQRPRQHHFPAINAAGTMAWWTAGTERSA